MAKIADTARITTRSSNKPSRVEGKVDERGLPLGDRTNAGINARVVWERSIDKITSATHHTLTLRQALGLAEHEVVFDPNVDVEGSAHDVGVVGELSLTALTSDIWPALPRRMGTYGTLSADERHAYSVRQGIGVYLRRTLNAVCLRRGSQTKLSLWWVRQEWNDTPMPTAYVRVGKRGTQLYCPVCGDNERPYEYASIERLEAHLSRKHTELSADDIRAAIELATERAAAELLTEPDQDPQLGHAEDPAPPQPAPAVVPPPTPVAIAELQKPSHAGTDSPDDNAMIESMVMFAARYRKLLVDNAELRDEIERCNQVIADQRSDLERLGKIRDLFELMKNEVQ